MANLRPEFDSDAQIQLYRSDMRELIEYIGQRVHEIDPTVDPVRIYDIRDKYPDAEYYALISGRGRGKSDMALCYCLADVMPEGGEVAVIRRRMESFKVAGSDLMADLMNPAVTPDGRTFIEHLTLNKANEIRYRVRCWWLVYNDPQTGKITWDDAPIARAAAVSMGDDTFKGIQWPKVRHIIHDEIIARVQIPGLSPYIYNEGVISLNLYKSIIRGRNNVTIWLLGNTVNKDCPLLQEMGLRHYGDTQPGDIQEYIQRTARGETHIIFWNLPPAEIPEDLSEKTADRYFCFDSPELAQITEGLWETADYPLTPDGHHVDNYVAEFFVQYRDKVLDCHICVAPGSSPYLYIHKKTKGGKDAGIDEKQAASAIIFSDKMDIRPNWIRNPYRCPIKGVQKIVEIMRQSRVYYASNECGELLRNYLAWANQNA